MKRVFLVSVSVLVSVSILLLSLAAGTGAWWAVASLAVPARGGAEISLDVKRGATLKPILAQLTAAGVLRHPLVLYVFARLTGRTAIQSGHYVLSAEMSPRELLFALHMGRVSLATLTVPEGLSRWEVRDLLAAEGWLDAVEFDALCEDPAFLGEHAVPGPSCDGYLFPETYTLAPGIPGRAVLAAMFAGYKATIRQVTSDGWGPSSLSEREFVTLASLVEKETSAADERSRIACVFYNRLRARPLWRLETDPSVLYAARLVVPDFDGNLKRRHLRGLDSPYNTYRIYGLPPGPIASPGRAALEAVAKPASCSDFFFVSQNNGRHVFCETLDCHNRAVRKWQIDYFRSRRSPAR